MLYFVFSLTGDSDIAIEGWCLYFLSW